jgi:hypothetical protein
MMTKIGNTGPGGIRPPATESTENVKQTVTPGEAIPDKASPSTESAQREVTGDKYAAGDLKTTGDRVKSQLDSKLAPKTKDVPKQPIPSFAPPYVPVGPVVTGDAPASKDAPTSKDAPATKHVPNQPTPGFAPPYVPVGPVVMGDNLGVPGSTPAITSETKQMNLKPDQFQINDQGNLVITNEKLIEYFKSLKESAAGGDINIGITNLKTPDKE